MTRAEVAQSAASCLALDIGATKVDAASVNRDGAIVHRERLLVKDHRGRLFDGVVEMLGAILKERPAQVLGVGCAGPMTLHGNHVSPLNIPEWRQFPLRERLGEALGIEVFVEGDVRALALAEGSYGAAKEQRSYLSMVVSTGIGGAIVLDGRLLDGDTGNAGHVGHLNVVTNGRLCSCGSYGCLEAEASGWAIEDMTGSPAYEADQDTRRRCAELVGRAVGTLASVLDFNHCYIAGSVALGYGNEFFDTANKVARSLAPMEHLARLTIHESGLGVDGPLLGAALVGFRGMGP